MSELAASVAAVRNAVRLALRSADLAPQTLVMVACSGGPDSLALAAATAFVAPRLGLRAGLVTVDHGLQAGSAERAADVVAWAKDADLSPAFTVEVDNPAATKASLGMETGALVMEGFRRVDEWRLIEGSFDFDEVLYHDTVAIERLGQDTNLTRQERAGRRRSEQEAARSLYTDAPATPQACELGSNPCRKSPIAR